MQLIFEPIMILKLFFNLQIDVRVVHRRSTPPELFRYCMFLSLSQNQVGRYNRDAGLASLIFGKSVNPIPTRGSRLCPPDYNWHLQIFAPSGIPDDTYQTVVSWLKCLIPFLVIIVNLGRGKRNNSWSKLLLRSEF